MKKRKRITRVSATGARKLQDESDWPRVDRLTERQRDRAARSDEDAAKLGAARIYVGRPFARQCPKE